MRRTRLVFPLNSLEILPNPCPGVPISVSLPNVFLAYNFWIKNETLKDYVIRIYRWAWGEIVKRVYRYVINSTSNLLLPLWMMWKQPRQNCSLMFRTQPFTTSISGRKLDKIVKKTLSLNSRHYIVEYTNDSRIWTSHSLLTAQKDKYSPCYSHKQDNELEFYSRQLFILH